MSSCPLKELCDLPAEATSSSRTGSSRQRGRRDKREQNKLPGESEFALLLPVWIRASNKPHAAGGSLTWWEDQRGKNCKKKKKKEENKKRRLWWDCSVKCFTYRSVNVRQLISCVLWKRCDFNRKFNHKSFWLKEVDAKLKHHRYTICFNWVRHLTENEVRNNINILHLIWR